MTVLARVTNDLDEPRGPDVLHGVEVPMEWLEEGASVSIVLPRLLSCARCEGGGCDVCGRKGAFETSAAGPLAVSLPRQPGGAPTAVRLRLPGYGARGDEALPPGHLILTVVPRDAAFGWAPSNSLTKLEAPGGASTPPTHWAVGLWGLAIGLIGLLLWWLLR